jgi:hypothetical protein
MGCFTVGKPVPLQAVQVCSLIFGVTMNLSGCPQFAASFLCAAKKMDSVRVAHQTILRCQRSACSTRHKIIMSARPRCAILLTVAENCPATPGFQAEQYCSVKH